MPELNFKRAVFVLGKIDEILAWEKNRQRERDQHFVDLGRYLCEVRAGQYWRLERMQSFDEFLERRFPESRRKAYYLMAIHERLHRVPKQQLREIGWSKATELAKIARRESEYFESATWLHRAQVLPKEEFKREVQRHLTGRDSEPWELLYFKLYKSQLSVIEQALETAGLMLGADRSRGYCLEMICADFLAGANLQEGHSEALILALQRLFKMLPLNSGKAYFSRLEQRVEWAPSQTGPQAPCDGSLPGAPERSVASRWLAVPSLRAPGTVAGSSSCPAKPYWRGHRRKPHHPVRRLSSSSTSLSRKELSAFEQIMRRQRGKPPRVGDKIPR